MEVPSKVEHAKKRKKGKTKITKEERKLLRHVNRHGKEKRNVVPEVDDEELRHMQKQLAISQVNHALQAIQSKRPLHHDPECF